MSNHPKGSPQPAPEVDGTGSPVASGAVAGAVGLAAWIGADATGGWLRIAGGVVAVITLAYAVYTLGLVVCFLAVKQVMDAPADSRLSTLQRLLVWVLVPLLTVTWALWAWLAGFDAAQWEWTGASLGAGTAIAFLVLQY